MAYTTVTLTNASTLHFLAKFQEVNVEYNRLLELLDGIQLPLTPEQEEDMAKWEKVKEKRLRLAENVAEFLSQDISRKTTE